MFLPHIKHDSDSAGCAIAEPQPLATVAAVHAIKQRSGTDPEPVTLSTGRVIVPDVRNSVVTHWNVADNPDAEMTEAEDTEFCQIQADRRKAKQNADFLAFVDKRERAKAEWLREHDTPAAGFLAAEPAVAPVPVRPSALSTAADDGFRPTEYKSAESESCEACSLWFKHTGRGLWRFYVYTDERDAFSVVGPHYSTKAELLGDLERYALEYGFPAIPRTGFLAADSFPVATLANGKFRAGLRGSATFQDMPTDDDSEPKPPRGVSWPYYAVTLTGSKTPHEFCQPGRDFEFIAADRPSGYQIQCGHIERHDTKRGTDANVVTVLSGEHGVFRVRQSTKTGDTIDETFVDIADARTLYDSLSR